MRYAHCKGDLHLIKRLSCYFDYYSCGNTYEYPFPTIKLHLLDNEQALTCYIPCTLLVGAVKEEYLLQQNYMPDLFSSHFETMQQMAYRTAKNINKNILDSLMNKHVYLDADPYSGYVTLVGYKPYPLIFDDDWGAEIKYDDGSTKLIASRIFTLNAISVLEYEKKHAETEKLRKLQQEKDMLKAKEIDEAKRQLQLSYNRRKVALEKKYGKSVAKSIMYYRSFTEEEYVAAVKKWGRKYASGILLGSPEIGWSFKPTYAALKLHSKKITNTYTSEDAYSYMEIWRFEYYGGDWTDAVFINGRLKSIHEYNSDIGDYD